MLWDVPFTEVIGLLRCLGIRYVCKVFISDTLQQKNHLNNRSTISLQQVDEKYNTSLQQVSEQ